MKNKSTLLTASNTQRKNTATSNFPSLLRFVEGIDGQLDEILDMPNSSLREIWRSGKLQVRMSLLEKFRGIHEKLLQMEEVLTKLEGERKII